MSEGLGTSTVQRRAGSTHSGADEEKNLGSQNGHSLAVPSEGNKTGSMRGVEMATAYEAAEEAAEMAMAGMKRFWYRFKGVGRKKVSIAETVVNALRSSWLNVFIVIIPVAWVAHFLHWNNIATFILCFFALMPLEAFFDWGGEQLAHYLGGDLGDLVMITLNNSVEAALGIILLTKCELKLLQSTIIGVILLHLLLIPGASFMFHGARIWEQDLHPHNTELNQSLLMIGVMSLVVPVAFFAALDRGSAADVTTNSGLVNDHVRGEFLKMSRGIAILLLIIYICSRIFLHDPPGEGNALMVHPDAPEAIKQQEYILEHEDPEANQWVLMPMLAIAVAIMAITAEFLVESIEFVREDGGIEEEWFGLVLLPLVSFAADGAIAIGFCGSLAARLFFGTPVPPSTLAKARAIDLSIQFILFWMPFMVMLGWWTNKPMSLLFDYFELSCLLAACFLVNYVTSDKKVNWIEGLIMLSFYIMIVLCAWYYPGQPEVDDMHSCLTSVAAFIADGGTSAEGASGE